MEVVRRWLNGTRNFTTGSAIYSIIGSNAQLKALLAKGQTPFAEELLFKELSIFSLADYLAAKKGATPEAAQEPEAMQPAEDKILNAFYNDWQPLFQKLNYLRHQLDKNFEDMNSAQAIDFRKPIAFEILDTEQRIKQIWAFRDHYLATGKLPYTPESEAAPIPTDQQELKKFIGNVKKNIRRNRQLIQDHPGEPKYVKLYEEYKALHFKATGQHYAEKESI